MAQSTKILTSAIRAPFWKRFGVGKTLPANIDHAYDNDFKVKFRNSTDTADIAVLGVSGNEPAILDANGNEAVKVATTASAVNEITVTNAAANGIVSISATGSDAAIDIVLAQKGAANIYLGTVNTNQLVLSGNQSLADAGQKDLISFTQTVDAVNNIEVTNAATATDPSIAAVGTDANVGLTVSSKGTGSIVANVGTTNRLIVNGEFKTIADGAPVALFEVACADMGMVGGSIMYLVRASDGVDTQALSGIATYAAVSKAGTTTAVITDVAANGAYAESAPASTLTLAFTAVDGADKATFRVQPTGSLVETVYDITYTVVPLAGAVTIL
ncbi:MAG TPA: hypothetical protein VN428_02390 [Bryobacteraceae bacterium]|nr:hypothetical protein [Bryobacteraceae bacterium]